MCFLIDYASLILMSGVKNRSLNRDAAMTRYVSTFFLALLSASSSASAHQDRCERNGADDAVARRCRVQLPQRCAGNRNRFLGNVHVHKAPTWCSSVDRGPIVDQAETGGARKVDGLVRSC